MRKVVLERPGVVLVVEAPTEEAGPGQALVQLRAGGICGSDLAAFRGTSPLVSYPRVLGHEVLVDVLECADNPAIRGQRAVLDPMIPCGQCTACRAGRSNCCAHLRTMGVHVDGGLQDLFAVRFRNLHVVPDTMTDEVAVLAEPVTIAYHAVQRSGIEAGRVGVIFGAGAIGLLIAQVLTRARGCRVMVIDVDPERLGIAESMGATPLQGDEDTLVRLVAEKTGGDMADVVFEASGNPVATRTATALCAHAGRIVLVGWNRRPVEMDTVSLMRKELDVLGSRNSLNAFPAVLRLLTDRVIDPSQLVTHRFDLSQADLALGLLDRDQGSVLKVLIKIA